MSINSYATTAVYTKFLRGTQDAYNALAIKEPDTLYFIYGADEKYGRLYLGDRLITASGTSSEAIIATLQELEDVSIDGVLDGQVLGYDAANQVWKPMSIDQAVSNSVMQGATAELNGLAGLVPAPNAGDNNKFLRGDGVWASLPEITGLKRKKINSIEEIDVNAPDAESYIYMLASESAIGNLYKEYIVIESQVELLGTSDINLENYVTQTELETSLGTINTSVSDVSKALNDYISSNNTKISSLETDIAQLKGATTWHELI